MKAMLVQPALDSQISWHLSGSEQPTSFLGRVEGVRGPVEDPRRHPRDHQQEEGQELQAPWGMAMP